MAENSLQTNTRRTVASARAEGAKMAAGANLVADKPAKPGNQVPSRTEAYTRLTRANGESELVKQMKSWTVCRVTLITAGPVDIGTRFNISPPQSGKGIELVPGQEIELKLSPGDRLYMVSNTVNRVSFTFEPVPYQDEIVTLIGAGNEIARSTGSAIAGFIGRLVSRRKKQPRQEVCPPGFEPR